MSFADMAEGAVKQAVEQFTILKKTSDRDIDVLQHLRNADAALTDPMQPANSIQKAVDEVAEARQVEEDTHNGMPEFAVVQGLMRVQHELSDANLGPSTADFGHLRAVVHSDGIGPASRVAVRDASALQAETLAWLRVQQLISDHLHNVSEETGAVLKASEQQ
ncbi:MAG TPA: hypothetical protein VL284_00170 [Thermoanaerobaculia bacterium]|nr:hypothetical protein [Thermoanaerobaculia bacterium]